jgi:hypothetical protein
MQSAGSLIAGFSGGSAAGIAGPAHFTTYLHLENNLPCGIP